MPGAYRADRSAPPATRRYARLHELRRLDPRRDAHRIHRATALYEFPFDMRLGLLLGFWRTFAVPSIATLLDATGETTQRTGKRADDTGILVYELIEHGLDHPRGRAATRRLNQLHRRFEISNDEHLYVLGTFIFVPMRLIDRYGWRRLCCHERAAAYHFWTELGRRMNIRDIPAGPARFAAWFDAFERDRFAPTAAARRLMTATRGLLADLPPALVPVGHALADALLDPPLRAATGTPAPPRWAGAALRGGFAARSWLLRRCPPRRRSSLAGGIHADSYPDGYDLARVGPADPPPVAARTRTGGVR